MMNCDFCESWICTKCLYMSKADYNHHVHTASSGMWFCAPCKLQVVKNIRESKSVEEKCKDFLKIYAEKLENLEKVIEGKCNKENLAKIIQDKINENNDSLNDKFSEKRSSETYRR